LALRESGSEHREFVELETAATVLGALFSACQEDCLWVNRPLQSLGASYKIRQLKVAMNLGFKIPDSLFTNEEASFDEFRATHSSIVAKVVNATPTHRPKRLIPTRIVDAELLGSKNLIRTAPVQFQKYIAKDYDVRVNVIGDRVIATEIHSAEVDGRMDLQSAEHRAHSLPGELGDRCIRLCRRLGLMFGAIDLVVAGGAYYFLEVNPNGKWGWIEERTDQGIAESLADLLGRGCL
jgi:glutathione synthase/RimK-type ligase-like ATP-grasp enzyme